MVSIVYTVCTYTPRTHQSTGQVDNFLRKNYRWEYITLAIYFVLFIYGSHEQFSVTWTAEGKLEEVCEERLKMRRHSMDLTTTTSSSCSREIRDITRKISSLSNDFRLLIYTVCVFSLWCLGVFCLKPRRDVVYTGSYVAVRTVCTSGVIFYRAVDPDPDPHGSGSRRLNLSTKKRKNARKLLITARLLSFFLK